MSQKPVAVRPRANLDVDAAVDYLLIEAGEGVALGFVDALQSAYDLISAFPEIGSARHAHRLAIPELRSRVLTGYPYIVFYAEAADHIDVWRVLHAQRDLPAWLSEP